MATIFRRLRFYDSPVKTSPPPSPKEQLDQARREVEHLEEQIRRFDGKSFEPGSGAAKVRDRLAAARERLRRLEFFVLDSKGGKMRKDSAGQERSEEASTSATKARESSGDEQPVATFYATVPHRFVEDAEGLHIIGPGNARSATFPGPHRTVRDEQGNLRVYRADARRSAGDKKPLSVALRDINRKNEEFYGRN